MRPGLKVGARGRHAMTVGPSHLVPALFALIGDRMWWPTRPAAAQRPTAARQEGQRG